MRSIIVRRIVFFCLCAAFVFFFYTSGSAGPPESLRGKPFSYTSEVQEMPEGWESQPIKYDPSVGDVDLVINLNRQVYQALLPIIKDYEQQNAIKIAVSKGTCGISAGGLSKKEIDAGVFCCPPSETDRLPGLVFHTIGIMPLVLIVHPENTIDNVTVDQARKIFQGKINRWSEVTNGKGSRGKDLPIQVIGRLHCKKRPGHWRLLLDNQDLFSTELKEVGAIPDMISLVASNPEAIGYESIRMVREYEDTGRVKPLKLNGYDPDEPGNLLTGRYPFYRTFNVTTWEGQGVENPHAQKLVEFILEKAEGLDLKYGIISASRLRQAKWKFKGNELINEPN